MDLSTKYLGLMLKNPLVPSASPLMTDLDNIKKLEAGRTDVGGPGNGIGYGAVFFPNEIGRIYEIGVVCAVGYEQFLIGNTPDAHDLEPPVAEFLVFRDQLLPGIRPCSAIALPSDHRQLLIPSGKAFRAKPALPDYGLRRMAVRCPRPATL